MGFKYRIIDKKPYFLMEIEPNEKIDGFIHHISGWLSGDVTSTGWRDLKKVKEFLKNPNEREIILGSNSYTVFVRKNTTTISYDYEYCNPEMVPCTLPTEMLCEILEIWIQAEKEHREKTKKTEE